MTKATTIMNAIHQLLSDHYKTLNEPNLESLRLVVRLDTTRLKIVKIVLSPDFSGREHEPVPLE